MPAIRHIRMSSFNRRSGVSISITEDVRYSSIGGVSDNGDVDEQEGPEESAEVQWADLENSTDDESLIDRMAKRSFAHFVALIQRR